VSQGGEIAAALCWPIPCINSPRIAFFEYGFHKKEKYHCNGRQEAISIMGGECFVLKENAQNLRGL